jgi:hypothetical protein
LIASSDQSQVIGHTANDAVVVQDSKEKNKGERKMNDIQKQYASANSLIIDLKEVASMQWIVIPDELDENRVISVRFYLRGHGQYFNRRVSRKNLKELIRRYKSVNTDVLCMGEDE